MLIPEHCHFMKNIRKIQLINICQKAIFDFCCKFSPPLKSGSDTLRQVGDGQSLTSSFFITSKQCGDKGCSRPISVMIFNYGVINSPMA